MAVDENRVRFCTESIRGPFWETVDEENKMNMKRGSLAQLNNQCVALAPKEHEAHTAVEATLREIREIFHRSGSLSSQHEVLDEIAKLLFAHVSSIDAGEPSIGRNILQGQSPANALRLFVAKSLKRSLPESMSFELSSSDLDLQLRLNEDRVGLELIDCFARNANREQFIQARTTGQLDIMNHAFGQFLAHTFVDEKELGQYLTPPAVVRTMVRLGLDSLALKNHWHRLLLIGHNTHATTC